MVNDFIIRKQALYYAEHFCLIKPAFSNMGKPLGISQKIS